MAERMAAEIWIGGRLDSGLVSDFTKTVGQQGVSREWGEQVFEPSTAEELLKARSEVEGALVLRLCDEQACGGALSALEAFLTSHRLPFRRFSDGKYEYDPELVEYRPDLGWTAAQCWIANASGEPVVAASCVRPVSELLAQAVNIHDDAERLTLVRAAQAELHRLLPPQFPPLPMFEVVISAAEDADRRGETCLRRATDLPRERLVAIVESLQQCLYLDDTGCPELVWNPEKDWNGADVCQDLASVLEKHGLIPQSRQCYRPPRK